MTLPRRKPHYIFLERDFIAQVLPVDEFDALVDSGYDDIVVVTPRGRWIASIDEWQEYGYVDLEGDSELRVLHRSYMGRA